MSTEETHENETMVRAQRRTVGVLAGATILGGLGIGASFSVGALLVASISGNDSISGFAATVTQLGAALAGIPLSRLAMRSGRRPALATGSMVAMLGGLVVLFAAARGVTLGVLGGLLLLGAATAVQLQSRFAAADLASPGRRSRDLSFVVWSITVGAVAGPNLIVFDGAVGAALGVPEYAGVFSFAVVAQLVAAVLLWVGLRPDPLLEARRIAARSSSSDGPADQRTGSRPAVHEHNHRAVHRLSGTAARRAVIQVTLILALGQAVMVALMSMTPLHLKAHDSTDSIIGITLSLHIAGMYALSPVFGMLADRWGASRVVLGGAGMLAVAATAAATAGSSELGIQTAMTLLGLGWGAVNVAGSEMLLEVAEPARLTRSQGNADTSLSAAGALGGAVAGLGFASGGMLMLALFAGALIVALVGLTVSVMRAQRTSGNSPVNAA